MHRILWLLIWCACFLTSVWAQGDPAIVDDIKPVVSPINQEGSLICTTVNVKNSHIVSWYKDVIQGGGKDFQISFNNRIAVSNNIELGLKQDGNLPKYDIDVVRRSDIKVSYILTVRYLLEVDSGNYSCTISSMAQGGYLAKKKGNIMVQVPPTIRDGMKASATYAVGDDLSLTCMALGQPAPNITWRREDGKHLRNEGFRYRGATFQIHNIQEDDAGNYICIADNSVKPPAEFTVQIKIFYSPKCSATLDEVGQAQNRRFNARLECIVSGNPRPTVQWKKLVRTTFVPINDDEKYTTDRLDSTRFIVTNTWYVLKIKNVQANDFTNYSCTATNEFGSTEQRFRVFETPDCQGPNCPSPGYSGASALCACTLTMLSVALSICLLKFMKY